MPFSMLFAQEVGLKDVYSNYFKVGTAFQHRNGGLTNANMRSTIIREFNSLTHEDELKPDATMVRAGSTNDDIQVQLNANARTVLEFAVTNNIPMRGHTLVWHSQTPNWFFHENMQNGNDNNLATVEVMNQRMESYIKNILELLQKDFPALDLYAYDVVNEIFLDNGSARAPGFASNQSPWVQIYNGNAFADTAFVYARKHAATTFPNMKLFYNDFNEYHPDGKRAAMVAMAERLGPDGRGVMDGIGMQSHLSTTWPNPTNEYRITLNAFRGTGLEIHVTELDITLPEGDTPPTTAQLNTQADRYKAIFQELINAKNAGANITSVSVWGVTDDRSWRFSNNRAPLLFNASFEKKPAYDAIVSLIPEEEWGKSSGSGGSSSSSGGDVVPCDYQPSFCGGMAYANVLANSIVMPYTGDCIFIGDFEVIQPALSSTVAINGVENTCGSEEDWSTCGHNAKPNPVDGGYYVFVKSGTVNEWIPTGENESNGWKGIVAKAKPNCSTSPIRQLSPLSMHAFKVSSLNNRTIQVESNAKVSIHLYDIKGNLAQSVQVPAGSSIVKLSVSPGIYVVKNGKKQTQKIMVR